MIYYYNNIIGDNLLTENKNNYIIEDSSFIPMTLGEKIQKNIEDVHLRGFFNA